MGLVKGPELSLLAKYPSLTHVFLVCVDWLSYCRDPLHGMALRKIAWVQKVKAVLQANLLQYCTVAAGQPVLRTYVAERNRGRIIGRDKLGGRWCHAVADCLAIVSNIANTSGEWEVENAVGDQHQLVQSGTCRFRVQGKGKNGNIDFHVGGQDIVDIIHSSIQKFGASGKVSATGEMQCKGDVKQQKVGWEIF
jgi:hypothetical protein